jgi:hypothetical protein
MFRGDVVWRGVVYAILMVFGKMVTGLWLIRFSSSPVGGLIKISRKVFTYISLACTGRPAKSKKERGTSTSERKTTRRTSKAITSSQTNTAISSNQPAGHVQSPIRDTIAEQATSSPQTVSTPSSSSRVSLPPKPKSLYPPAILGLAMIARGEIGYLIASLAQSRGIFSSTNGESSDIYLVIIWAISICTLIGPIAVGTLTRRVKKLQRIRVNIGGEDPLGVWGI